jgi:hypothetical protein
VSLHTVGAALHPFLSPTTSIWRDDATQLARASSEEVATNHYAAKLANQLFYATNSQSGKFHGYAGMPWAGYKEGFATVVNFNSSTVPVYVMSPAAPREKIWLVTEEGAEETLDEGAEKAALRTGLSSVPVPSPAEVLHGSLPSGGPDAICAIWCPATDELWELRRLAKFAAGAHKGELKCALGGYLHPASQSNGVYATGAGDYMGNSASGLVRCGGMITLPDLVRVLRNGKIGHALSLTAVVTQGPSGSAFLAPATRNDAREIHGSENGHNLEFEEDGVTPNPAYGTVDAVPEGLRCAFAATSRASEYGITKPLEAAIYEAIREHGLIVRDSGPTCALNVEDARALPLHPQRVNPFAGATSPGNTAELLRSYVNEPLDALIGSEWKDPTLPTLEEALHGTPNVLSNMPWRELEQLEPSSS